VSTPSGSPFIVRYHAAGFPNGMIKSNDYIRFYENELVHALFTVGRAPGDRLSYGEASVWELLHRSSLVRAYIRQDYDQRLVLSRLALELDRSEKVAVSYAIGQAMTSIFSQKLLSIQYLMHVDRYASRWSVRFANRRRADLFGFGPQGWIVAEAKGRSTSPDTSLRANLRSQKASIISIQGGPPWLSIGCVAYFSSEAPWLRLDVFDPVPHEIEATAIEFDIDRYFLTYYEPFITAIDSGERGADQVEDATIVSARFSPFGLSIGLLSAIDGLVRRAKAQGDVTGLSQSILAVLTTSSSSSVFPDGSFVEANWEDSISINDWLG
jgi:hypothetical protein